MDIRKMDINELQAADYNPRVSLEPGMAEYEKLKASLENFGFVETPVWNERTGRLVGGHQRVRVAKDLGYKEIEVSVVDLTEAQEKALNVALNKISGQWDEEKLQELLAELDADMLSLTGFDADELVALLPEDPNDVLEDDEEIEPPEEPYTQTGDIWLLGPHKVICGDSTEKETMDRIAPDGSVDLVITDPPYNVAYTGKTADALTIENDEMTDANFYAFLYDAFTATASKMKQGAAFYIWHADTETVNFRKAANAAGMTVKQNLIWVKHHFVMGRQDYHWRHEPCLYGWKEGAAHYFLDDRTQDTVMEQKINFKKLTKEQLIEYIHEQERQAPPTTIIKEDRPSASAEHPTMKPIKLIARQIINSSRKGETVLDPFGGSGSTLLAADQLNRRCYTIELDPSYADVIVKRYIKQKEGTNDITLLRNGQEIDPDEWDPFF